MAVELVVAYAEIHPWSVRLCGSHGCVALEETAQTFKHLGFLHLRKRSAGMDVPGHRAKLLLGMSGMEFCLCF